MTTFTTIDFDFFFTDRTHVIVEDLSAFEITNIIDAIDDLAIDLEDDNDFEDVTIRVDADGTTLSFDDGSREVRVDLAA